MNYEHPVDQARGSVFKILSILARLGLKKPHIMLCSGYTTGMFVGRITQFLSY
jgi:hypothetical protein